MQETLERISKQITEKWTKMDRSEKVKISLTVFFALLALGIGVFVFTKATYVDLTNGDVSYEQIGEIQKVLDNNGISYSLSDNGSTIMVNKKDLGKAKIAISTENILGSEYSWSDLVQENMMGLTESEKNIRYVKIKEDELASAIKNIQGIRNAVVKLTVPQDSPFVGDNNKTSKAGIQLSLTKPLSEKQVLGIAKFVASSVDKLTIENVSISDTNSNLLFSGDSFSDSSGLGVLTRYDEARLAKENDIEKKVTELLAPMYGEVRVKANLKINFDKYKETSEKVSSPFEGGKKGIPINEQIQTSTNVNGTNGQEPGYNSNSEATSYYIGESSSSKSETQNSNITYAINKTVSELEKSTGDIILDESSISVIVYRTQVYNEVDLKKQGVLVDTTWDEYMSRVSSEAQNKTINLNQDVLNLIKNATGISNIAITGFEKPVFISEQPFNFPIEDYIPVLLMILFVIVIAWVLTRRTKTVELPHIEPELSVEQMLSSTKRRAKIQDDLPEIEEHDSETKRRIEDFIEQKPQLVAQLLKNWIAEDWE